MSEAARHTGSTALEILQQVFGYPAFRGQQQAVIHHLMQGRDALVLMPTGGGKSLCYQIPAIAMPGLGLVISPLIALMRDQVRALELLGVGAAYLNSSLTPAEQQDVLARAERGALSLLYVAPERVLREDTLTRLGACRVNLIAIDEAHCVSAWGHDFRQDYLELGRLAAAFPGVPRAALTATADARTREDIVSRLALDEPGRFVSGFDRPNIRYSVQPRTDARRQLLQLLDTHRGDSGIVYCLSRRSVEATAEWLRAAGFDALPYHAGLDPETRHHHQERFLSDDGVIMVATIAFGMGIDKPDVRFVAHLDLPKNLEAYYQETGRAGRDGAPADAWMIYGLQDVVRLSRMVDESPSGEEHKRIERAKLDALLGWCEVTSCRRRHLLAYFGDSTSGDCGNCDVCLTPPLTWDATDAARKALSCVYRTGQRFGAGHVIDVLRGQSGERITQLGHDRISTFGIGAELSATRWRSVFRQLVVRGYLQVDHGRFGALKLTAASRPLLRGELTLELREQPDAPKSRSRGTRSGSAVATLDAASERRLETLKALRRQIATEAGVPPYVVFHDATLVEMVLQRPDTDEALLAISGIGRSKLEKYGAAFLETIAAFADDD